MLNGIRFRGAPGASCNRFKTSHSHNKASDFQHAICAQGMRQRKVISESHKRTNLSSVAGSLTHFFSLKLLQYFL